MKVLKLFHSILATIPFIWFVCFLTILTYGTIKLGYVPKYGNLTDPNSLNLEILSSIHAIFGMSSILAIPLWILILIILKMASSKSFALNRITTILFIISLVGFIVFRFFFIDHFMWVGD